jgi:hypothetical protein
LSCGQRFRPCPQAPGQLYCSEKACQRERRRRWQREKQRNDADHRDNQRRAQRAWAAKHASIGAAGAIGIRRIASGTEHDSGCAIGAEAQGRLQR